ALRRSHSQQSLSAIAPPLLRPPAFPSFQIQRTLQVPLPLHKQTAAHPALPLESRRKQAVYPPHYPRLQEVQLPSLQQLNFLSPLLLIISLTPRCDRSVS